MADKSKIEWTEATWNFLAGCSKVSQGCKNCYAIKDAHRLAENPNAKVSTKYKGTTVNVDGKLNWTGKINLDAEMLLKPIAWKRGRKIFVNSMSDLFHESVKDEWIDKAFAVMALCSQHTFQILTKRPERMRDYLNNAETRFRIGANIDLVLRETISNVVVCANKQIELEDDGVYGETECATTYLKLFPLPNVWLGVSVENQITADERIPLLLETPAAVRFLSVEPMLGQIDLVDPIVADSWEDYADQMHYGEWDYLGHAFVDSGERVNGFSFCKTCGNRMPNPMHNNQPNKQFSEFTYIDWVIAGGESGANARPVHPDWVRSIRNQCIAANVPFFFKQWGTWGETWGCDDPCGECVIALKDGTITGTDWQAGKAMRGGIQLHPFGKKKTGRLLDGRTWDEMPK